MPEIEIDAEALARDLGVETTEPPTAPPPPKTPLEGEEKPKPPDETKPPGEGDQPPEGEKKDGEGAEKGETPPDPLAEFTKDPDKALKGLLAHPVLGPMLNRWLDTGAKHQVEAATKGAEATAKASVEQERIDEEDGYFSKITPDQLKEDLADPETGAKAAAAYGRYNLRKEQRANAPAPPTPGQVEEGIQMAAARSLVVTYKSMVDGSDLSDEVKAELQPEKFTHLGSGALEAWGKAIYEAHVKYGVDQAVESAIEEARANLDPERKGLGGGRPPGAMPDLMGTDSSEGLRLGLEQAEQARRKQ